MSNLSVGSANSSQATFNFNGIEVRIHVDAHGQPWFALKDIAIALGVKDAAQLADVVKGMHKGKYQILTPGGLQDLLCVTEAGLNKILMRSSKPAAEPFQDWLAEEVLPSIRKTGGYSAMPAIEHGPMVQMALAYEAQQRQLREHDTRLNELEAANDPMRQDYITILTYCVLQGLKLSNQTMSKIGKVATKLCEERMLGLRYVPSDTFARVKAYPPQVVADAFASVEL
jgi:prophage antirepressor-like protein